MKKNYSYLKQLCTGLCIVTVGLFMLSRLKSNEIGADITVKAGDTKTLEEFSNLNKALGGKKLMFVTIDGNGLRDASKDELAKITSNKINDASETLENICKDFKNKDDKDLAKDAAKKEKFTIKSGNDYADFLMNKLDTSFLNEIRKEKDEKKKKERIDKIKAKCNNMFYVDLTEKWKLKDEKSKRATIFFASTPKPADGDLKKIK